MKNRTLILIIVNLLLIQLPVNVFSDDYLNKNQSKTDIESYVKEMAQKCWNLREKQTDSALQIGLATLDTANKYNLTKYIPMLNGYIGVIYIHYLHDIRKSIPYFHKSMEGSIKNGDSIRIAYSYNNLGDAFMLTGNFPLALQYSEKSLNIFKNLNYPIGIAYGYINLGLIYRNEKKYELAIANFEKAVSIRSTINDSLGFASALLELAKTYEEKGNINLAMKYYENSYDNHLKIKNISYTAKSLNGMAKIYYARKQYDKAYDSFMKAIELNEMKNNNYDLIENYLGLALVYGQLGEIQKGENIIQKALTASIKLGLNSSILKSYHTYAKFYEINNDFKKASESLNSFLVIYDSVFSMQQYEILNEIQNNFNIQSELINIENQLKTKRNEQFYTHIIIGLMIILLILIIWRLRTQSILNRKLAEANHTKDKLFSVISHDLRSPFNAILGFSNLISEDYKENYTLTKYANFITQTSLSTLDLLNNLLTWARSQTGKISFNPEKTSIETLFNELGNFFQTNASNNKINLQFKNSIDQSISADKYLLRIILINLISNAIKYTPDNGTISVESLLDNKKIKIIVTDTGIGLTDENLQIFNQKKPNILSTKGLRNEEGTGLGLAICYDLIKIHNGSISVTSERNVGTTFTIEIPQVNISE